MKTTKAIGFYARIVIYPQSNKPGVILSAGHVYPRVVCCWSVCLLSRCPCCLPLNTLVPTPWAAKLAVTTITRVNVPVVKICLSPAPAKIRMQ